MEKMEKRDGMYAIWRFEEGNLPDVDYAIHVILESLESHFRAFHLKYTPSPAPVRDGVVQIEESKELFPLHLHFSESFSYLPKNSFLKERKKDVQNCFGDRQCESNNWL